MTIDIILLGGGLANGLLAYRLKQRQPHLRILLLEQGNTLGGNHTWAFFESDLTKPQQEWIRPFIHYSWPGYQVRFPSYERNLQTPYYVVTSEAFHRILMDILGESVQLNTQIQKIDASQVTLADGSILSARLILDGRGLSETTTWKVGYQKFWGQEIETVKPHGIDLPIVMDATIPQESAYRFIYVLPFDRHRLLLEATEYSDTDLLRREPLVASIEKYAAQHGIRPERVLREEAGVLPVVLSGESPYAATMTTPVLGLRGGFFHPVTSYSLLEAVRVADDIAGTTSMNFQTVHTLLQQKALANWRNDGVFRLLNRMLFQAAEPNKRYLVLQKFYKLPVPTIERFYARRLTVGDYARLFSGKPPVPILRAISCLLDISAQSV